MRPIGKAHLSYENTLVIKLKQQWEAKNRKGMLTSGDPSVTECCARGEYNTHQKVLSNLIWKLIRKSSLNSLWPLAPLSVSVAARGY